MGQTWPFYADVEAVTNTDMAPLLPVNNKKYRIDLAKSTEDLRGVFSHDSYEHYTIHPSQLIHHDIDRPSPSI